MSFGPKIRKGAEEILASRKDKDGFIDYEFKDYKGANQVPALGPVYDIPNPTTAQVLPMDLLLARD